MKITAEGIKGMKRKEKITALTAYDFITAKLLDSAGIEILLVGDSVGNVLLGYANTRRVTMQEMLHHVAAVCRAQPNVLVVADMPINSYKTPEQALENAKKFIALGADAVKLEGSQPAVVQELVKNSIPVMGHIGLLPQTIDPKVQGKDSESANRILQDAKELDSAGCFSIVIECVPEELGKKITNAVSAPTIGIGAGPNCDGQILVINDLVGFLADDFKPKFVKQYAELKTPFLKAVNDFKKEVKSGKYPSKEFSYS